MKRCFIPWCRDFHFYWNHANFENIGTFESLEKSFVHFLENSIKNLKKNSKNLEKMMKIFKKSLGSDLPLALNSFTLWNQQGSKFLCTKNTQTVGLKGKKFIFFFFFSFKT